MRYLAIAAAAAFLAVTTAGSAGAQAVTAGPVALTETQLDSVTAAGKDHKEYAAYHNKWKKNGYKKDRGDEDAKKRKVTVKFVKKVVVQNGKKITKVFKVLRIKVGNEVTVKRHLVKKVVVDLKKFKRFAGKKRWHFKKHQNYAMK